MLKAIHAQEDLEAARAKASAVAVKLREMNGRIGDRRRGRDAVLHEISTRALALSADQQTTGACHPMRRIGDCFLENTVLLKGRD